MSTFCNLKLSLHNCNNKQAHDFLWFGIQLLDVFSCLTFLSKFQDVTSLRSSTRDVGKEAYTSTRGCWNIFVIEGPRILNDFTRKSISSNCQVIGAPILQRAGKVCAPLLFVNIEANAEFDVTILFMVALLN